MTPQIKPISMDQANKITIEVFGHFYSHKIIKLMNRSSNMDISRGVFLGRKLIGVYLLNNESITSFKGKAVYGLSLALLPEYRNQGYDDFSPYLKIGVS